MYSDLNRAVSIYEGLWPRGEGGGGVWYITLLLLLSLVLERLLDHLYLLRHGRQHPLLQPVELVKAAPGPDLAQAHKDASHGLEVKRLITVEHQHETTQLMPKGFHRLSLSSTSRTCIIRKRQYGKGLTEWEHSNWQETGNSLSP